MSEAIGVVVIGRNEGERLKRCLASVVGEGRTVVYVDSGSTDGSQDHARSLGVDVVDLDMTVPFTMSRGRNAGFARLTEIAPDLPTVQFVDGDCELVEGYLDGALEDLGADGKIAVVSGRRRERYPERSLYNRLCDTEWERPPGPVSAVGGDMMVRTGAFREVGGFAEQMIAGEEAEFCFRLRERGYTVLSVDREMTLHDAAIERFGQWWRRSVRTGHAYAECAHLHGRSPERLGVRHARSALFWGAVVPLLVLATAIGAAFTPWSAAAAGAILLGVVLQTSRIAWRHRRQFPGLAGTYALFVMIGKVPLAIGVAKYRWMRLLGRRSGLIEYK